MLVLKEAWSVLLELPLQAGGNPHNRGACLAVRLGVDATRRRIGVVAIGGHPASAGTKIVVALGPLKVAATAVYQVKLS